MRKALLFIRACCLAVLLCAIFLSTPAAADDGPTGTLIPRARPVDLPLRSLVQTASNDLVVPLAAPAVADAGPTASPAPRAVPAARSYPRGFNTYGQQFALFFVLATWMYLLSQLLLFGAVFNRMRLGAPRERGILAEREDSGQPPPRPADAIEAERAETL